MLFMETININNIKEKNREKYLRFAEKQDHGTRGTVRDKDPYDERDWDVRGFKNTDKRVKVSDVDSGLDDYVGTMTPEELELEADKILLNDESKVIKAELPTKNVDLFETEVESSIMAELMNSDIDSAELSILALRDRKRRQERQPGYDMGDYND